MNSPYQQAIDQAQKELDEVRAQEREMKRLHEELLEQYDAMKGFLSDYIDTTRAIMNRGKTGGIPIIPLPSVVPANNFRLHPADMPSEGSPLWQWAAYVMRDSETPFTVGDILRAMSLGGVTLHSKNRVQIMRKTLLDKPSVFLKLEERGKFALVSHGLRALEKEVAEATP